MPAGEQETHERVQFLAVDLEELHGQHAVHERQAEQADDDPQGQGIETVEEIRPLCSAPRRTELRRPAPGARQAARSAGGDGPSRHGDRTRFRVVARVGVPRQIYSHGPTRSPYRRAPAPRTPGAGHAGRCPHPAKTLPAVIPA